MKKIIVVLLLILSIFLTACNNHSSIIAIPKNFTSVVDIKTKNNNYKFKYFFNNSGDFEFSSINQPVSIDIKCKNGIFELNTLNLKCDINKEYIENSPLNIINSVLIKSINAEIMPDYNGNYIYYGVSEFGQYKLYLQKNGLPIKLELNDITVLFTQTKYERSA